MMSETDGFDAIRRIDADASPVGATILMVPSATQLSDRDPSTGKGRLLIKPVRQSELLDAILKSLSPPSKPAHIEFKVNTHEAAGSPSLRILLAEDNVVNQRLAARVLEKQGHQVVVVGDGKQALDLLLVSHFDLVIMDVQMPIMDGLEATRDPSGKGDADRGAYPRHRHDRQRDER